MSENPNSPATISGTDPYSASTRAYAVPGQQAYGHDFEVSLTMNKWYLELQLNKFEAGLRKHKLTAASPWAGFSFALVLAIIAGDYKDTGPVDADTWHGLMFIGIGVGVCGTVWSIHNWWKDRLTKAPTCAETVDNIQAQLVNISGGKQPDPSSEEEGIKPDGPLRIRVAKHDDRAMG